MRLATQSVIVPMRMHCGPREKILPGIGVGWHSMQRTLHRFISGLGEAARARTGASGTIERLLWTDC